MHAPRRKSPPVGVTISQVGTIGTSRPSHDGAHDAFRDGHPNWPAMLLPGTGSRAWRPPRQDIAGVRQPRKDDAVIRSLPRAARLSRLSIEVLGIDDYSETPVSLTWWATADREGRFTLVPERTDPVERAMAPGSASSGGGLFVDGSTGGSVTGVLDDVLYTEDVSTVGIWVWAYSTYPGQLFGVARLSWVPVWE